MSFYYSTVHYIKNILIALS